MLLLGICGPCHTAVQQDAEDTGLVHLNPSVSAPFSHTLLVSLDMAEEAFSDAFVDIDIGRSLVVVEPK